MRTSSATTHCSPTPANRRRWSGHRGHIDPELIAEAGIDDGTAFVCGSNGFVETGSELLLDAGYEPQRIRTERFGPTG